MHTAALCIHQQMALFLLHHCYIWPALPLDASICCVSCLALHNMIRDCGPFASRVVCCRALHDLGRDGDFEAYGYYGRCEDTPCQSLNPSQQNALSGDRFLSSVSGHACNQMQSQRHNCIVHSSTLLPYVLYTCIDFTCNSKHHIAYSQCIHMQDLLQ